MLTHNIALLSRPIAAPPPLLLMRMADNGNSGDDEPDRRLVRSDFYGDLEESEDFALYGLPLAFFAVTVVLSSLTNLFPNTPKSWLILFLLLAIGGTWDGITWDDQGKDD